MTPGLDATAALAAALHSTLHHSYHGGGWDHGDGDLAYALENDLAAQGWRITDEPLSWELKQREDGQAAVRAALKGHEPQMAGDGRDGDEHLGCSCGWEQSSDNDYEPWSRHVKP